MEELETQPENKNPEPEEGQAREAGQLPEDPQPPEADQDKTQSQTVSIEEWMASSDAGVEESPKLEALEDAQLLAVLEACVYVAEEPLMPAQIAAALGEEVERIRGLLDQLVAEFDRPEHGVSVRVVAGGYKMATKPEHHDAVRSFVKSLKAPLKLSLPALETLAVVAYKQPVTSPEIMEIRGVQGGSVLKTLLDRKLITEAGRKNVIGKPILYKTTKEFLVQFGLKDLTELPSLKEFEDIRRMAMADSEVATPVVGEAERVSSDPADTTAVGTAGEESAVANSVDTSVDAARMSACATNTNEAADTSVEGTTGEESATANSVGVDTSVDAARTSAGATDTNEAADTSVEGTAGEQSATATSVDTSVDAARTSACATNTNEAADASVGETSEREAAVVGNAESIETGSHEAEAQAGGTTAQESAAADASAEGTQPAGTIGTEEQGE